MGAGRRTGGEGGSSLGFLKGENWVCWKASLSTIMSMYDKYVHHLVERITGFVCVSIGPYNTSLL